MSDFWGEALKVLVSSSISIVVTGIYLQKWQFREHFIEDRVEDLVDEVDAAAEKAVVYWSRDTKNVPADPTGDRAIEADIVSRQMRIARMRSQVGDFLDKDCMIDLFSREGDLFRAFTGGEFRSPTRVVEPDRFEQIRNSAALYINVVQDARRKRVEQGIWSRLRH